MTTPIIMLVLLVAPYALANIISRASRNDFDRRAAAAVGLGVMFAFTGVGHFIETEPMAEMLPSWVPARVTLVYLTGILELAIAAGFFLPQSRQFTGWVAVLMLVLFFPANVYAAVNHVPMGGHAWGPVYLLVRAPLQAIILLWVYWFTVRPNVRRSANLTPWEYR